MGMYEDRKVKQVASTNRYKCIGNAVTVDVVCVVGKQIIKSMSVIK